MALTGKLTYRTLDIDNALLRVTSVNHRVVDTSTEAEDGTVTWSKTLYADYSGRVYKDAAAYAANPVLGVYSIDGTFTPSTADDAKDIVEQTYVHLKTLSDYSGLADC